VEKITLKQIMGWPSIKRTFSTEINLESELESKDTNWKVILNQKIQTGK